jgi:hypothetical protein
MKSLSQCVGQTGRLFKTRFNEHIRVTKHNKETSIRRTSIWEYAGYNGSITHSHKIYIYIYIYMN